MLDWFKNRFRSSPDHPLATGGGLEQVLSDIPRNAPLAAVRELGEWFTELEAQAGVFDGATVANAAQRLDEGIREQAQAAWELMLAQASRDGLHDEAWLVLSALALRTFQSYRLALQKLASSGNAERDKRLLALLATRAMAAIMRYKLLLRLRYRAPEPSFWQSVHGLVAQARKMGVLAEARPAYPGEEPTSVLTQYAAGLLLDVAPVENLVPEQVACVAALIGNHQRDIPVRTAPGATVPYHVQPDGDAGPSRQPPDTLEPGSLFFGPGKLAAHVFNAFRDARNGAKPADWVVRNGCDGDLYLGALAHLSKHWSDAPPNRKHQRRTTAGELLVVTGFTQVRRMISASAFARSGRKVEYRAWDASILRHESRFGRVGGEPAEAEPETGDAPMDPLETLRKLELAGDKELMERWQISDISDQGFGAFVSESKRWLRAGVLIGFRLDHSLTWRAGIVRRIGRSREGRRLVGVEVLGSSPAPAQYRPLDVEQKSPWDNLPDSAPSMLDAILVSRAARLLILEKSAFAEGRPVEVAVEGEWFNARLKRLLAKGRDFELIEYDDPVAAPDASLA